MKKKLKSENTIDQQQQNCGKKYALTKKRSEESSTNVCSADLEDSIGKEEL